tara:strand:- start:1789 stop:2949 length:1161 start_codon:yes stop_codon:yes gene_type:complete
MSSLIPGNITFLDIEDIYGPPSNNPRQNYSEEGMEELISSLRAQGQLRPVVGRIRCEHDPADSEGFAVVLEDGHSRLEARRQGDYTRDGKNIRREDIKVLIAPSIEMRAQEQFDEKFPDGIEDVEELSKQLSFCVEEIKSSIARESHAVNTIREKWDVYGEAVSLDAQVKMQEVLNPDLSRDELMQKVADANGTRMDTLRIRLSFLDESKTPKDVQEALRKGELSQSQALVLRRVSDEETRKELTDKTYTDDMSVAALNKVLAKLEKKAAEEGASPVVTGKRKSRKKQDSSLRGEESILEAISDLQGTLSATDPDSEPDEYERTIGAIAALQYVMTPESEEDIHHVIDAVKERIYAEESGESEESEESEEAKDYDGSEDLEEEGSS